jgi:hypothetical protein
MQMLQCAPPYIRTPDIHAVLLLACTLSCYNLNLSATSVLALDLDLVDDLRRSPPSLAFLRRSTGLSSSSDSSTVKRSGLGSRHEWRWPDSVRDMRRRFCCLRLTSSCARPRVGSVMVIFGVLIWDTMCGVSFKRSSSRPMNDSSSSSS